MYLSNQELFDIATQGILRQGKSSISGFRRCMYRSEDGCKCAIGHIIPDDKYIPEMEMPGTALYQVMHMCGIEYAPILSTLQNSHDSLASIHSFIDACIVREPADFITRYIDRCRKDALVWNLSLELFEATVKELGL